MVYYYIHSTNYDLLQAVSDAVDVGEQWADTVRPADRKTTRYANVDTHPDGVQYAYLVTDVVVRNILPAYMAALGASQAAIDSLLADWDALQAGTVQELQYTIPTGYPWEGETIRVAQKDATWTPPEVI